MRLEREGNTLTLQIAIVIDRIKDTTVYHSPKACLVAVAVAERARNSLIFRQKQRVIACLFHQLIRMTPKIALDSVHSLTVGPFPLPLL